MIIITMTMYHTEDQPAWMYAINLNTLVAILSALLRVCMIIVLEEGVQDGLISTLTDIPCYSSQPTEVDVLPILATSTTP